MPHNLYLHSSLVLSRKVNTKSKAALEEANVYSIMAAHNEVNGIPAHSDKWMMTDLLRDQWGFDETH